MSMLVRTIGHLNLLTEVKCVYWKRSCVLHSSLASDCEQDVDCAKQNSVAPHASECSMTLYPEQSVSFWTFSQIAHPGLLGD